MKASLGPHRDSVRSAGFTLVELLVVIGILSVLAAIAFPVLTSAKTAGKKAQCIANLRSIGVAMGLYSTDNDQNLPNYQTPPSFHYTYVDEYAHYVYCECHRMDPLPFRCWLDQTHPYLTLTMLYCPEDTFSAQNDGLSSYEYKLQFAYMSGLDSVEKPSKVALAWEQWAFHQRGKEGEADSRAWLNVLFLDGSAKFKNLATASSAVYGDGPDLHVIFGGVATGDGDMLYEGEDFID